MLDVIPDFGELFSDALRSIMFFFDNIIYGFIPTIYKLFLYLSELDLFGAVSDNPLQKLVNRIYVLLGIFMLFKVSFSLLQYLVDPAAFRDSSKGMGKLVTNVLVSLVLLVSTPIIFEFAMNLQKTIVHSNAIGQLILGTNSTGMVAIGDTAIGIIEDLDDFLDDMFGGAFSSDFKVTSLEMNADQVETMAKDLQFLMFGAFFSLNLNSDEVVGTSSSPGPFYSCAGTSGVLGSFDTITINGGKCLEELNTHINEYDDAADYGVDLYSFYKYYEGGQTMDDRIFVDFDRLLNWRVDHDYVFNYMPGISTAVGVYIIFLLISFSIDIAVRAIKLCFLQMVAPIAIVSYIDPKETMSNGKLYNWIKECGVTYFSLFLRIATLFFIMLLVSSLCSSVLTADGSIATQFNDPDYNIWVYLFLIIGAFMFAKELPKLIESIFGIKGSGDLHLNPFKNAGFATLTGGAVGLGVGAAASGIAAGKTSLDSGESRFTAFRRGLGGAVSGGLRGGISSVATGGKNAFSRATSVSGDVARNAALKANTKFPYRVGAYVRNAIGAQSLRESLDQQAGVFESMEKSADNMESRARDQLSKKHDQWKAVQGDRKRNEEQYAQGKITKSQYTANLQKYWNDEQKMIREYIAKNGNMGVGALNKDDVDLLLEKENLARNIKENGVDGMKDLKGDDNKILRDTITSWAEKDNARNIDFDTMKELKSASHNEAARIKNSNRYEDASNAEKAKLSDLRQSFLNKK